MNWLNMLLQYLEMTGQSLPQNDEESFNSHVDTLLNTLLPNIEEFKPVKWLKNDVIFNEHKQVVATKNQHSANDKVLNNLILRLELPEFITFYGILF